MIVELSGIYDGMAGRGNFRKLNKNLMNDERKSRKIVETEEKNN